jgi:hypothetical protein
MDKRSGLMAQAILYIINLISRLIIMRNLMKRLKQIILELDMGLASRYLEKLLMDFKASTKEVGSKTEGMDMVMQSTLMDLHIEESF